MWSEPDVSPVETGAAPSANTRRNNHKHAAYIDVGRCRQCCTASEILHSVTRTLRMLPADNIYSRMLEWISSHVGAPRHRHTPASHNWECSLVTPATIWNCSGAAESVRHLVAAEIGFCHSSATDLDRSLTLKLSTRRRLNPHSLNVVFCRVRVLVLSLSGAPRTLVWRNRTTCF